MHRFHLNHPVAERVSQSTLRELCGRAALVALSVAVTLAMIEGFFHWFPGLLPREIQQRIRMGANSIAVPDPTIGHLHKPNAVGTLSGRDFHVTHRTDAFGFRNPWPWPERIDIVAVGDSLTFGYGVADNQTWPVVLGQALPDQNVLNLGLIAAAPEQYLRVYDRFTQGLKPRLLLVGLYPANDFWDAALFDRWLESGSDCSYWAWRDYGKPDREDCSESVSWRTHLFLRESYVYNILLEFRNRMRSYVRGDYKLLELADGKRLALDVEDFQTQLGISLPGRPEFQLVLNSLHQLAALAQLRGARVVMVIQPSKEEVYLPIAGQAIPDLSFYLREELEKAGIEYFDLTTIFRRHAARGEKLFFETDPHPNSQGYALIADSVLAYLKESSSQAPEDGWKASENMTARLDHPRRLLRKHKRL
jgi:lysophospholipase L1-like esterase